MNQKEYKMEQKPLRIKMSRITGFNLQEYSKSLNGLKCIIVSRPSKWGNPFKIGTYLNAWGKAFIAIKMTTNPKEIHKIYRSGLFDDKITLENSLKWYEMWLKFMIESGHLNLEDLKGANLSCWCGIVDKNNNQISCHADILLELATKAEQHYLMNDKKELKIRKIGNKICKHSNQGICIKIIIGKFPCKGEFVCEEFYEPKESN